MVHGNQTQVENKNLNVITHSLNYSKMTRISKSAFIDSPIDTVFKYASDYTKWEDWFEGVSDFKPTSETSRGNGARYTYKAKMLGMNTRIETEIFDFVENKGWKGKSKKGVSSTTFWEFMSKDNGTIMTYGLDYDMPIPLIGRWLDNTFMKPQWEKIISISLENLKGKIES